MASESLRVKNPSLQALLVDELDGAPAFAGPHQGPVVPTYGCYALHRATFSGILGLKRLFLLRIECTAFTASVVHLVRDVLETDPALWTSIVKHMIAAFVSSLNIIIPLSTIV